MAQLSIKYTDKQISIKFVFIITENKFTDNYQRDPKILINSPIGYNVIGRTQKLSRYY